VTRPVAALGIAGLLLLAGVSAFGQGARGTSRDGADVGRLQVALAQEQKAEFLYLLVVGSGRVRSSYPTLVAVHEQHLQALAALTDSITGLGAEPVRPKSFNDYVDEAHAMSATSEADVVDLARSLERDGADLYGRLGPQMTDSALIQRLARLGADDEAHGRALAHAISG
jgi:hypothetical protein